MITVLKIFGYNNTAQNHSGITLWQRTPSYTHQSHPSSRSVLTRTMRLTAFYQISYCTCYLSMIYPPKRWRKACERIDFSYISMQHKLLSPQQHITYLWRCSAEAVPTFPGMLDWPFSKTPLSQVCFMVEKKLSTHKKIQRVASRESQEVFLH